MTAESEALDRKIRDAALRAFAVSDSENARPVLVEIRAEDPTVVISSDREGSRRGARAVEVRGAPDERALEEASVRDTAALLDSMGLRHRYLSAARVFVAELQPEQLRQIAASPSVRAIVPNRDVKQTDPVRSRRE